MGVHFHVICHFCLIAFNILFLSLVFVSLFTLCLSVFLLGFIPPETLCASQIWWTISFSMLEEFSAIISSNIFFRFVLSLFSFWDLYNANVGVFNVVSEVSYAVFISFHSFSIFCSMAVISTILSSRSFICSSTSVILLLIPSSILSISACFFL